MHTNIYLQQKAYILLLILAATGWNKANAQTYANSQTNGVTGLCLLCGVSNPGNPVDQTSLTDYSTFNITVGLLGVSVHQTLIFPAASNACDSLVITIGSANSVISANLFGGVTVQTFNGSTANNDARTVDSSIVRLVQNNTLAQIVLHPTSTFDRVTLTLSSSILGLLNAFRIYYAYTHAGTPALPAFNVPSGEDCGTKYFPILNYMNGIHYQVIENYYDFFGSPIYDTTYTLSTDSIYAPEFYAILPVTKKISVRAINPFTGCSSDTVQKEFIDGGFGAYATVDADSLSTCYGDSVTFHAYLPGYITTLLLWYDAPTGGNLLHTGNYFTVNPDTSTTYYVTTNNNCNYPVRRPVYVAVSKLPAPIYSVPGGFVCTNVSLVIQNPQTGVSYIVHAAYSDSHNNPLGDTAFTVNSDTITFRNTMSFLEDNVVVAIQAIDSATGCRSDTVTQEFTFGAFGQTPAVSPDSSSICIGDSTVLHGFEPNGSAVPLILWYNAPAGGSLLYTGNYYTVHPTTATTYYATAKLSCEAPVRTPATVIVASCPSYHSGNIAGSAGNIAQPGNSSGYLYPNPTTGMVLIDSKYNLAGATIMVTDMQGKILKKGILNGNSFILDGDTGLYVVTIITQNGIIQPGKILLKK